MIDNARKWFEKATKINPDLGDAWIYLYKLESIYGKDEVSISLFMFLYILEEIVRKCIEANPKHGDLWCLVSKNINNWRLKTGEILKKSMELENIFDNSFNN